MPSPKSNKSSFSYRKLFTPFVNQRTQAVIRPFNPANEERKEPSFTQIDVYDYNEKELTYEKLPGLESCFHYISTPTITWINMDGIRKKDIERVGEKYGIHPLIQEDILSMGQRSKMDDMDGILFALMHMLYFNNKTKSVETEQVSLVLTEKTVISFQEDVARDVFDPIRERLKVSGSKLRQRGADYLFYSLIDIIVDNYFVVMEKLGEQIECMEEEILGKVTPQTFHRINQLRKEMILLKRIISPVRELVSGVMRSESNLLEERTSKYFKDVHDHILQANDLCENYRDMVVSLQDLYLNNMNLRMNDVMKTLAIVTTIMAPATVIGGIFGMNFDVIPYMHQKWGFYGTVASMILIPVLMIVWFKHRGWFQRDLPGHDNDKKVI